MRKIKSIFSKTMIASIVMLIIIAMTEMLSINKSVFASESGTVTADNVNFRQKASSSAEIIQSLKKGASLTVEGTEGDFYKVRYNSIEGYVSKQFVKVNKAESSASGEDSANNGSSSNTSSAENSDDSRKNSNDNSSSSSEEGSQNVNDNQSNNNQAANGSESSNEGSQILTEKEAIEKNKTKIKNETEIYVLPLLNSSKLGTIAKDEDVMLVSINGKWAYIRGSKKSGWVNKEELESQTIYLPTNNTKNVENTTNKNTQNSDENNQENNQNNKTNSDNNNNNSENDNSDATNNDSSKDNENNQDSESKNSKDPVNGETEATSNSKKTMYINVDAVNIRKEASTTATILNSAEKNSALEVLDTSNQEWYKVKTSSGTVGYVLAKYLSENAG